MFYTFQMKVSLALKGGDMSRFKFSLAPSTQELIDTLLGLKWH